VYSKPKALEGLGTDQVVKENLRVNWIWFLLLLSFTKTLKIMLKKKV